MVEQNTQSFFDLFPKRSYDRNTLDRIYIFSQDSRPSINTSLSQRSNSVDAVRPSINKTGNRSISFKKFENNATFYNPTNPSEMIVLSGFRNIVFSSLIIYMMEIYKKDLTHIYMTSPITIILKNDLLYKTNKSTRYTGIHDYKNLSTAINKHEENYESINNQNYTDLFDNKRTNMAMESSLAPRLFTNESKKQFIEHYKKIVSTREIIIIPIHGINMSYTKKSPGHAQYLLIHVSRKMYTIIDGQYQNVDWYNNMLFSEMFKLDGFITELMGEEYAPYLYRITCPQAIVRDRNCIWWSLMITFMYLLEDPHTVDLNMLLKKIIRTAYGDYVPLLNSFKVFVMDTVIQSLIDKHILTWEEYSSIKDSFKINTIGGRRKRIYTRKSKPKYKITRRRV